MGAVKNTIQILLSATDKASATLKNAGNNLVNWAKNNELSFAKLKDAGQSVFSSLTTHIKDFTGAAMQTQEAQEAMDRLSKNMNLNSKSILDWLKTSSKGTVAEYDLILAANKAMSLGVAKNTGDFTTLMDIARTKAKNMGITTTQAYNDIVTGLGRWSAMILDNLGIVVNSTEANEEYAKSIGKAASQLTDAEKKQALINKVIADGRKEMQAMGDIPLSNKEKMEKFAVAIDNLKGAIGNALIPVVQNLVTSITPLAEKVANFAQDHPELLAWILKITAGLAGIAVVMWTVGMAIWPISTTWWVLKGVFSGLAGIIWGSISWLSSLWPIFSALTWPIGIIIWVLTALGVAYATNLWGFRDFVNQLWEDLQPILQEIWTAFIEAFWLIRESVQEVRAKLEPILIPLREWFWEVVSAMLPVVWDLVASTFKVIWNSISSCIDILGGIIDFIVNVFTGNWSWAWESLKGIFSSWYNSIIWIFSAFNIDLPWIIETIKTTITNLWDGMFNGLKNIASSAIGWISDKISAVWDKIKAAKDAIASLWWGWGEQATAVKRPIGGRASWWAVLAGQLYKINELGSEYFRPAVNGTITRSPSQSSPQITMQFWDIHIGSESDMEAFAQKVRSVMTDIYRNLSLWTY